MVFWRISECLSLLHWLVCLSLSVSPRTCGSFLKVHQLNSQPSDCVLQRLLLPRSRKPVGSLTGQTLSGLVPGVPPVLTLAPAFGALPLQRTAASALLRDHLSPANSAPRVLWPFGKVSSALGGTWRSRCSLKRSRSGPLQSCQRNYKADRQCNTGRFGRARTDFHTPWRWAAGVKICTGVIFSVISLECSLYQEIMKSP